MPASDPAESDPATPDMVLIELVFFAYRDFVGEPDLVLERYGFGRAHHRVLHFVSRRPGLTIAALLDILRITKQSLARVLKDLVDGGFVESRSGADDRRQRLLHPTAEGAALAAELAGRQGRRIAAALHDAALGEAGQVEAGQVEAGQVEAGQVEAGQVEPGVGARDAVARFLMGLIDPGQRDHITAMIRPGPS